MPTVVSYFPNTLFVECRFESPFESAWIMKFYLDPLLYAYQHPNSQIGIFESNIHIKTLNKARSGIYLSIVHNPLIQLQHPAYNFDRAFKNPTKHTFYS